jgi:4-hydroxy-3-polyprenylbenzoate decarboxylase
MTTRLIVAISGASGAVYGIRLLQALASHTEVETHLIISGPAKRIIQHETDFQIDQVEALATHAYDVNEIGAAIASGSFKTAGMVIIPCSIKTLSAVANCYADNLITRAADVTLKERRTLVVSPRETPLHAGHLRLMLNLAMTGAVILPPMPAFYYLPQTLDDIIDHTVGHVLEQFGIAHSLTPEWQGTIPTIP